jgi:SpoVK/Ycf46/Vps4 family AAA+-type ATPase
MSDVTATAAWLDANQRHLMAAIGLLRKTLELYAAARNGETADDTDVRIAQALLAEAEAALPSPSAIEMLCARFGLSDFERDVLLLCAGPELDGAFPQIFAAAQGDVSRRAATFSLALAALPGAHWSALLPAGPLRKWRLVDFARGEILTQAPLRIDERTLHFLTGLDCLDERLQGVVTSVIAPKSLPPLQSEVARRLHTLIDAAAAGTGARILQLCGEAATIRAVAAKACEFGAGRLVTLRAADLPANTADREGFARVWEKENRLSHRLLLIESEPGDSAETTRLLVGFSEVTSCPVLLGGREPVGTLRLPAIRLDVPKPSFDEQKILWRQALGRAGDSLNGELDRIVMQFNLGAPAIEAASAETGDILPREPAELATALWDSCRRHSRQRLDDLAQRVEPAATWDDLVLPPTPMQRLRDILLQVRHRATVYQTWGFEAKSARGLGINALFAGPSGTGKTMAAEVLAGELRLDLYRIDLSSVVSKYIGETEKNLRRVFDAAEDSGAVLLFDEADALFGKRSEVRDSHDRYANLEVSYLLQRMEAYRGLAILTTNQKAALDDAFLRRLRFVVEFPFPDAAHRTKIWERVFPQPTPTEGLDADKLARLNVAGGNIRNVALHAAFLAAEAKSPVRMTHLLDAARNEYAKLEKPLMESETRGWV